MSNIEKYDYASDQLDITMFDEKGLAILRRKLIKGEKYLFDYTSHPELADIVAKGISAFLFSSSYGGKYQLEPISWDTKTKDVGKYFNHYFNVCKKFYLENEKSNPNSVNNDIEKEFIKSHLKIEGINYEDSKQFLLENNKSSYVLSYLKWVRKKTGKSENNCFNVILLLIILIIMVSFCILQFILKDCKYNYVQIIVTYIDNIESETVKDFGRFLNVGIVTIIYLVFKKLNKLLK